MIKPTDLIAALEGLDVAIGTLSKHDKTFAEIAGEHLSMVWEGVDELRTVLEQARVGVDNTMKIMARDASSTAVEKWVEGFRVRLKNIFDYCAGTLPLKDPPVATCGNCGFQLTLSERELKTLATTSCRACGRDMKIPQDVASPKDAPTDAQKAAGYKHHADRLESLLIYLLLHKRERDLNVGETTTFGMGYLNALKRDYHLDIVWRQNILQGYPYISARVELVPQPGRQRAGGPRTEVRKNYKLTREQLERFDAHDFRESCNCNEVWKSLGNEMGFDPETVKKEPERLGSAAWYFTAVPVEQPRTMSKHPKDCPCEDCNFLKGVDAASKPPEGEPQESHRECRTFKVSLHCICGGEFHPKEGSSTLLGGIRNTSTWYHYCDRCGAIHKVEGKKYPRFEHRPIPLELGR